MSTAADFIIKAEPRTIKGKAQARRMRRTAEMVPGVIYGAHQEPQSIQIPHNDLYLALQHEAVFSHILTLKVGDKEEKVILKDLQRHPAKPKLMHIDFMRINMKEKLTMTVPIHFEGEHDAPGAQDGGVIHKNVSELEIRCLPTHLPEYIAVNMSTLGMEESIHLSDLQLPQGVELTAPVDEEYNPILVAIHMPHEEVIEESAPEAPVIETEEAEGGEPKAEGSEGAES
ncbi:MAG TPA: 50S ribosomal protein L25/general stress protein Ctc [Coxiellaceae bacterium]|nr:50S ribosomal protein L25/general stress protein Ctc [Coxiellaceae bacterium]